MGTRRRWIAYVLAAVAALMLAGAPAALAGGSAGAAGLQPAVGFQPFQELQLLALDGAAGDMLGMSVAHSDGVTIAGAPARTVGGNTNQGGALVFWHSGELHQQLTLTASDGAADDGFGYGVAIDGDTAVVGAPGAEVDGQFNLGAVYVFERSGDVWVQQAKLTPSDGQEKDGFGIAIALDGDTLVVGAMAVDSGAVYVFTRTGGAWSQQAKLTASDGQGGDTLGYSVGISGDTVVSGAPGHDVGGNDTQGAAYVFVRSGGTWSQQAALTASDGSPVDAFGWSSAVDGDTLLVGAPGVGEFHGSSYVFTRSGSTWTRQVELGPTEGHAGAAFGSSCAVSGDAFVIASQLQTVGANEFQGAVYVWQHHGTEWLAPDSWTVEELTASDGATGDIFGYCVDAEGGTVAVGAPNHAVDGAALAGAAYLYVPPVGPGVTVSRPGGGWHKRPVTLTFTAVPAENGAPVAATQYWIDGVSHMWTDARSLRITQQGVVRIQVRAVDVNGTPGDVRHVTVRVDTRRPRVVAGAATASGRAVSRLAYSVTDPAPGCGHALVRLVVSDARGRVLTRSSTLPVTTNAAHSIRVRTGGLAPGTYRVAWRAVDTAGNFQRGVTMTTLQVR